MIPVPCGSGNTIENWDKLDKESEEAAPAVSFAVMHIRKTIGIYQAVQDGHIWLASFFLQVAANTVDAQYNLRRLTDTTYHNKSRRMRVHPSLPKRKGVCQMMDYVNAFWVGGLICALVQILMEKTKLMPGRIMVLLVVAGAVIGFLGWYEPFQEFAGAGASVPLLGFGNVLMKGVKEAVDEQGLLGVFAGGFKAGAVGTSAALIFGYLASLVFKSKMKH